MRGHLLFAWSVRFRDGGSVDVLPTEAVQVFRVTVVLIIVMILIVIVVIIISIGGVVGTIHILLGAILRGVGVRMVVFAIVRHRLIRRCIDSIVQLVAHLRRHAALYCAIDDICKQIQNKCAFLKARKTNGQTIANALQALQAIVATNEPPVAWIAL